MLLKLLVHHFIFLYNNTKGGQMEKVNENKGNILYVLNTLKKYSDSEHILSIKDIQDLIKKDYDVDIDGRTIRRNISLLIDKFKYDITTFNDNRKGYYYSKDLENDFTLGEIIMLVNQIKISPEINERDSSIIIDKLKKQLNIYDSEKIYVNKAQVKDRKANWELINIIEELSEAIKKNKKVRFNYNGKKITFSPRYIVYRKFKVLINFGYILYGTNNTSNDTTGIIISSVKNLEILDEECEFLPDTEFDKTFLDQ